jgi:hypothetical protein
MELYKIATNGKHLADYIELMDEIGLLELVLPEIKALQGMLQPPRHHPEGDASQHTLCALRVSRSTDPVVNISILFHDVGKAVTYKNRDGKHTYYGHDAAGLSIIDTIAARFKLTQKDTKAIKFASKNHMKVHYIQGVKNKLSKKKIVGLVNDDNWNILKDVCFADEMSRGETIADEDAFIEKMQYAEDVTKSVSVGGAEGLKSKMKALVNGSMVMQWVPEINEIVNRPLIGDVIGSVHEWIINNDKFDNTEEQIKAKTVEVYNQMRSTDV